jgi:CBS domain-containing protein
MSIGQVCCRNVDVIDESESVDSAACRMRDRDVGMLVVVDLRDRPVGIVTAHDLVVRAYTEGPAAGALAVSSVMTPHPKTIAEEAPIASAVSAMAYGCVRRLPVVDRDGRLVGVISLDRLLAQRAEEFTMIGRLLESQIPYRRTTLGAALES